MRYEIDADLLKEILREKEWREAIIISDEWALQKIITSVGQWWQDNKNKKLENTFPRTLNATVRRVLPHAPRKARERYQDLVRSYFQAEQKAKRIKEKAARKAEETKRQFSLNFG